MKVSCFSCVAISVSVYSPLKMVLLFLPEAVTTAPSRLPGMLLTVLRSSVYCAFTFTVPEFLIANLTLT